MRQIRCVGERFIEQSRSVGRVCNRKVMMTAGSVYPTERDLRLFKKLDHDTTSGFSLSRALR